MQCLRRLVLSSLCVALQVSFVGCASGRQLRSEHAFQRHAEYWRRPAAERRQPQREAELLERSASASQLSEPSEGATPCTDPRTAPCAADARHDACCGLSSEPLVR